MIFNLIKTAKTGSVEDNEAAEAAGFDNTAARSATGETLHRWLERKGAKFAVFTGIALVIGGAVEIIPMLYVKSNVPTIEAVKPYSALELEGRDLYISNGCYTCHSQMVRPFRWETDRYGEYSKIGEFVYDHPFQWGSRRTGPDLARAGVVGSLVYKNAAWHYKHFVNAQEMAPGSIMPNYPWFAEKEINTDCTPKKIRAMQTLGVPYPEGYDTKAVADLKADGQKIADELKTNGINVSPTSEMIAIIAYIHKLGRDISQAKQVETTVIQNLNK